MSIITDITDLYQAYSTKRMNENELASALMTISYRFEVDHSLSTADLVKAVLLLTDYALSTENSFVRASLFDAVHEAILYNQVSEFVNWDNIVAHLDQLNDDDLLAALYFLSFSKNEKYIPFLGKYTQHQNKVVREDALGAIESI